MNMPFAHRSPRVTVTAYRTAIVLTVMIAMIGLALAPAAHALSAAQLNRAEIEWHTPTRARPVRCATTTETVLPSHHVVLTTDCWSRDDAPVTVSTYAGSTPIGVFGQPTITRLGTIRGFTGNGARVRYRLWRLRTPYTAPSLSSYGSDQSETQYVYIHHGGNTTAELATEIDLSLRKMAPHALTCLRLGTRPHPGTCTPYASESDDRRSTGHIQPASRSRTITVYGRVTRNAFSGDPIPELRGQRVIVRLYGYRIPTIHAIWGLYRPLGQRRARIDSRGRWRVVLPVAQWDGNVSDQLDIDISVPATSTSQAFTATPGGRPIGWAPRPTPRVWAIDGAPIYASRVSTYLNRSANGGTRVQTCRAEGGAGPAWCAARFLESYFVVPGLTVRRGDYYLAP